MITLSHFQDGRVELLTRCEEQAVHWIVQRLSYFDPQRACEEDHLFVRKALVELALLAAYRRRLFTDPFPAPYEAILNHVDAIAQRPSYRELVAREHATLLLYGLTYAGLRLCGREHLEFRWILEQVIGSRYATLVERIPYRRLDLIHFLELGDFKCSRPSFEDIFPHTILAGQPNALELGDSDAYSITHTLFYVTDFGCRSMRWPADFDIRDALSLIETMMRQYRLRDNADMVAELIASSICLGIKTSSELDRAWVYMLNVQTSDGRVPGPAGFVLENEKQSNADPAYLEWKTSYHTTIVAALSAMMARRAVLDETYPCIAPIAEASRVGLHCCAPTKACEAAIERARKWLAGFLGETDLAHALRAAAGLAIRGSVCALPEGTPKLLDQLARRLDDAHQVERLASELGADTLLLTAISLQRARISCTVLDSWVDTLARSIDISLLRAYPRAFGACSLLAELGRIPASALAEALPEVSILVGDTMETEDAYATALRLTEGADGSKGLNLMNPELRLKLAEHLQNKLRASFQSYKLHELATILRALVLIGEWNDRICRDGIAYLLSQQRFDGGFGYLGSASEAKEAPSLRLAWTLAILMLIDTYLGKLCAEETWTVPETS